MIKEDEVLQLLDEKGQISNTDINKYLASKNIISIDRFGVISLKLNKEFKAPYFEYRNKILNIIRYRNKGNMGVTSQTNDITEDALSKF